MLLPNLVKFARVCAAPWAGRSDPTQEIVTETQGAQGWLQVKKKEVKGDFKKKKRKTIISLQKSSQSTNKTCQIQ